MRKKGKKIKTIAVLPKGLRLDVKWELPVRMALLSMNELGILREEHLYDLCVLGEMSNRVGCKGHYKVHVDALNRLLEAVYDNNGEVTDHQAISIEASVKVLLEYIKTVSNLDIAKAAMKGIKG